MSYQTLVRNQVKKAFKQIKDLGIDVTFTSKTNTTYDFATHGVSHGTSATTVVKCLLNTKKKEKSGKVIDVPLTQSATIEMLLPSELLPQHSIYDTATINGVLYNIVQPVIDDGYLLTITAKR